MAFWFLVSKLIYDYRIKYLERKALLQGNFSLLTLCKKVTKIIIPLMQELKRQTILPLKPEYVLSSKFTPSERGIILLQYLLIKIERTLWYKKHCRERLFYPPLWRGWTSEALYFGALGGGQSLFKLYIRSLVKTPTLKPKYKWDLNG